MGARERRAEASFEPWARGSLAQNVHFGTQAAASNLRFRLCHRLWDTGLFKETFGRFERHRFRPTTGNDTYKEKTLLPAPYPAPFYQGHARWDPKAEHQEMGTHVLGRLEPS